MTRRRVTAFDALPVDTQHAIAKGYDRCLCPRCGGGSTHEHSLSVRSPEDCVYTLKCYRSTCDWYAVVVTGDVAVSRKKIKPARIYDKPTKQLDNAAAALLTLDYGLRESVWAQHGWRMIEDARSLVLPVRDPYGRDRGHITRTLYETPKRVCTYKATAQPFLDWWLNATNMNPVVVVEDCLSACRLAGLGYNAVALLGTGMSQADAREIAEHALLRPVYLALDRDAFEKAIKLRDRHAHLLKIDKVLCLEQDIKDIENDVDIRRLVSGGKQDWRF